MTRSRRRHPLNRDVIITAGCIHDQKRPSQRHGTVIKKAEEVEKR